MYVQVERHTGRHWIVTSSLVLFQQFLYLVRRTVAAASWGHTQLCRSRTAAADRHDVTCQSSSGSAIAPTSGNTYKDNLPTQSLGTCNEACTAGIDDMTSQTTATASDLSMTRTVYNDVDMTSYSLLSASDVSELLPESNMDGDEEEERRLCDEMREICRDLADIRACAQLVGARCHDDKWRRGDALTLGVTEALTPRTTQTTRTAAGLWADTSAVVDWRLDESMPENESRDVILSDHTNRKLSRTCSAAELMTSSPAEDSVADIYIDDELDDVIA